MRIDNLIAGDDPVFSFEFFPPKTPEGLETLYETIRTLAPLEPGYVSVTYGAAGATRDGTVEISTTIKREHGIETMAHLSCVGETQERLRDDPRAARRRRDREHPRAARRPAAR